MRKFRNILGTLVLGLSGLVFGLGIGSTQIMAKDADGDIVIVIDAGHGGKDCGTKASNDTYGSEQAVLDSNDIVLYEDDINLALAQAMRDELKQYDGVKVYLTRSDSDEWITNTGRAMVAREMNADFLISLHINSAASDNSGALVIRSVNQYYAEQTEDLGLRILDRLSELGLYNNGVIYRTDNDYTYEDYYTLIAESVRVGIPAIIVEHCFLTNPKDAMMVCNPDGSLNRSNITEMGIADAQAVVDYFNLKKRAAEADSETSVTLAKGYSIQAKTPEADPSAKWFAIDSTIASVDANGLVTAVNAGTTNIVYKLDNGESGFLTIEVEKTTAVGLVGCLDPTFYSDGDYEGVYASNFADINLKNTFGVVINNDGTSAIVTPTVSGMVDYNKVGEQDIPISYDGLKGYLRVVHRTLQYAPEVTEKPTEPETEPPTETETVTQTEQETESGGLLDQSVYTLKLRDVLIAGATLLILLIVGLIILIVENNKKRRRRGRRRYY